MCRNNKVTIAKAATKEVTGNVVQFVYDERKETYYGNTLSGDTAEGFYDTLPADHTSISISLTPDFTNSSNTITASCEQKIGSKAVFMLYHTTVTVPAGVTYRVDYKYDWQSSKSTSASSESSGWTSSMCLLGENADVLKTAKFNMYYDPYITPNVMLKGNGGYAGSSSGTSSFSSAQCDQLVYKNTDSTAKSFDTYFLYIAGMRASSTFSNRFSCYINISVSVSEDLIDIPQNLTATYDANYHWLDTFEDSWIDPACHLNTDVTEVKGISYVPFTGGAAQNLGVDTTKIIDAGEYTVTMGLASGAGMRWSDETTGDKTFTITIGKAKPTVDAVFPSGRPFITSGFPQPTSYKATCNGVDITGKFEWINQNQLIEVNKSKEYEWTFKPDDNNNYDTLTGKLTLNFQERRIVSKTYSFDESVKKIYTKTSIGDLMDMITLEVIYTDSSTPVKETNFNIESAHLVAGFGNSYVMVSFGGAPEKFEIPSSVEVVLAEIESLTVMFNQGTGIITVETPLDDLKQYLTVWAKWNYSVDQIKIENASDYKLSGTLAVNGSNVKVEYEGLNEPVTGITVTKASYNIPDSVFEDKSVHTTGSAFNPAGWIDETQLPAGMTVSYTCGTDMTSAGEHIVTVKFSNPDPVNYNDPADKTAKLTISDAAITGVTASVKDGAKIDVTDTLEDLKAKIKAELEFDDGTKGEVKAEDLTVICNGVGEDGKLETGMQTVTIKYTAKDGTEYSTTLTVTVEKAKVALPVYKGTLSYTGAELKPTANDFDGYNAEIMSFVESKTVAGMNAGTYKAVFALNDPDRYEWASTTTLKKSVFTAVVYDGETTATLEANEAAVEWNIAKAVITATKAQGKLPVFASESYKGSLAEVVGLKYYTDETCTEEIAADALGYNTSYYVRAELLDSDNFELDETATDLTTTPFEYLTPEKELTVWEKIVKFLTVNWLWLVIALVALILLITIIAVAARAAKKKREREERRLAEEKEERKREQEERRLEREERMARMNQQQVMPQMMMPQMMQMPQQMPQMQSQYAPQPQPMAMGGSVEGSQFAIIQAELAAMRAEQAAMRAEQNTAKEVASMRVEQSAAKEVAELRNEITFAKRGDQVVSNGIPMDRLTELIRTEVNNALAAKAQPVAQSAPSVSENGNANAASAAATQVPPDAVMTTVTTTKIDTTKKPVQNAQATAARSVVRNYVAPMPVDDGRVFDVGGFYKPADPLTDYIDDGEEKK